MPDLALPVQRWVGRWLFKRLLPERLDITKLSSLPDSMLWPLKRDGMDPMPRLAHTESSEPVVRLKRLMGTTVWLVTGYDAVRSVLSDATNFSNDVRHVVGDYAAHATQGIGGLGFTDPPEHTALRRLLTPEFTVRRLARLAPRIDEIVAQQLDAVEAAGPTVDLVPTFAFPIPFQVVCELLGLPVEDRERFRRLGPARFDITRGGVDVFAAMGESRELLLAAVRQQRTDPGDGLIGTLIKEHGDEVDDIALAGLADGVFLGGYETSVSMLSLGSLLLLQDPVAKELLCTDDASVNPIVEEMLRYLSVVQIAFPRFARHDLSLFGQKIAAGDVVVCSLSGGNRDSVLGDDPRSFNPRRAPVQHLAFGYGFHRCVGAELARMELRAAFRALARRFPDMQLAVDPADLEFRELSIVYGIKSLPVRIGAARCVDEQVAG